MKGHLLFLAVLGVALIAGCIQTQPQKTAFTLPKEAVKLSEVVPETGERWGIPKDWPFGPIYLVYQGKVIGIEYMMSENDLESNPITLPSGEMLGKTFTMSTMGQMMDHTELTYMPKGHAGHPIPHYDVHMYFITKEEQSKIKPQ